MRRIGDDNDNMPYGTGDTKACKFSFEDTEQQGQVIYYNMSVRLFSLYTVSLGKGKVLEHFVLFHKAQTDPNSARLWYISPQDKVQKPPRQKKSGPQILYHPPLPALSGEPPSPGSEGKETLQKEQSHHKINLTIARNKAKCGIKREIEQDENIWR
ncbi:hypothetical protein E2542_SST06702 [Spatholobus suberectus]|nr:hypothetical protein E2542_SST06702 [Spatholobus suberectus]